MLIGQSGGLKRIGVMCDFYSVGIGDAKLDHKRRPTHQNREALEQVASVLQRSLTPTQRGLYTKITGAGEISNHPNPRITIIL